MAIKVIFVGPMGAGKTTAIRTISDFDPISTEAKNSDRASVDKAFTTVAMDYGELTLDSDRKLTLYGVPGQKHFDFIWPIVANGALGGALLLDCSRDDWQESLLYYVDSFRDLADTGSLVLALNRAADEDGVADSVIQLCEKIDLALPFFFTDPRNKDDVYLLLEALAINAELDSELYGDMH
ncbi:GTP-binding protein [Halioxenophilus aromaticivorans]|uniref:ATP/GTP-binding protein n=1 Tax=Halioxenophilus aromaticivorans TaxID=1306992 RepID=A0AAV3UA64_9ALTE